MLRLGLVLVILLILSVIGLRMFISSMMAKGVEKAGTKITKVEVRLGGASLSPLAGKGQLTGLMVGNPEGFKTPAAIKATSIGLELEPRSLFADKVIVRSIKVVAPEVTFEGGLHGNNLSKLLENIRGTETKEQPRSAPDKASGKQRLQVDDVLITGGKLNLAVNLLPGKAASVDLPDIHLTALGQNPEGITAAELSEKLLRIVLENATKALPGQLGSTIPELSKATEAMGTGTVQRIEKITKGLSDLLKSKR